MLSWKELQEIDQADLDYDEQLRQLAKLLEQPSLPQLEDGRKVLRPARAEWIVRWLLKKLGLDDVVGKRYIAFSSLGNPRLPLVLTDLWAKVLNEHRSFIGLVVLSFSEALQNQQASAETRPNASLPSSTSFESSPHDGTSKVGKRKRDEIRSPSSSPKRRKTDLARAEQCRRDTSDIKHSSNHSKFVHCIDECLAELVYISDQPGRRLGIRENDVSASSASLLESAEDTAARLLGNRLSVWNSILKSDSSKWKELDDHSLQAFLRIWESNASEPSRVASKSEQPFLRHCLLPIAELIHLSKIREAKVYNSTLSLTLASLERLIAKHVFAPLEAAHSRSHHRTEYKREEALGTERQLASILGVPPESQDGPNASRSVASEAAGVTLHEAPHLLPVLFEIGVRCSNRSRPVQRADRAAWLDVLFIKLSLSGGFPVDSTPQKASDLEVSPLVAMLQTLLDHQVRISRVSLASLARHYCGLAPGSSSPVKWTLISRLISLEPSIFAPGDLDQAQAAKSGELDLPERLLLAMKSLSLPVGSESNAEAGSPTVFRLVKGSILIPLLHHIASTRRLSDFLITWEEMLFDCHCNQRIESPSAKNSLWNDIEVLDVIRDTVQEALSIRQVLETIKSDVRKLEATERPNAAESLSESYAVMTLLTATLQGITDDATLQSLEVELHAAVQYCIRRQTSHATSCDTSPTALNLLTVSFRLWSHVADYSDLAQEAADIVNTLSKHVSRELAQLPGVDLNAFIASLASLGDVTSTLQPRHIQSLSSPIMSNAMILQLHRAFPTGQNTHSSPEPELPYCTAAVLTRFPMLLLDNITDSLKTDMSATGRDSNNDAAYELLSLIWTHASEVINIIESRNTIYLNKFDPFAATRWYSLRGLIVKRFGSLLRSSSSLNSSNRGRQGTLCQLFGEDSSSLVKNDIGSLARSSSEDLLSSIPHSMLPKSKRKERMQIYNQASRKHTDGFKATTSTQAARFDDLTEIFIYLEEFVSNWNQGEQHEAWPVSTLTNWKADFTLAAETVLATVIDFLDRAPEHTTAVLNRALSNLSHTPQPSRGDWTLLWIMVFAIRYRCKESRSILAEPIWGDVLRQACYRISQVQCSRAMIKATQIVICYVSQRVSDSNRSKTLESLLLSLTTILAPTAHELTPEALRYIHPRLCLIISKLINHQHYNLGLRYHVLFPVIQALMRCLFLPTSINHRKRLAHPPWLPKDFTSIKSAERLRKSLERLADPPLSSVSNNRTRRSLTDPVQEAKKHVGRFAPLLLAEIVRCHIYGKIDPSARKVLMQGIWAMFKVAPREQLDALAASFDEEGRSVFKSLWAEYRRERGSEGGRH
ncbi:MAG: hypothetical protein M1828_004042 [Chrysothrix sp. TS-e1954]|nr:MAG: hypothetical protein M1828_004042 [Chrysothrix sp. TS-e1954]